MMHEHSTGELLASAIFVHRDDKRQSTLKPHTALKGLSYHESSTGAAPSKCPNFFFTCKAVREGGDLLSSVIGHKYPAVSSMDSCQMA